MTEADFNHIQIVRNNKVVASLDTSGLKRYVTLLPGDVVESYDTMEECEAAQEAALERLRRKELEVCYPEPPPGHNLIGIEVRGAVTTTIKPGPERPCPRCASTTHLYCGSELTA